MEFGRGSFVEMERPYSFFFLSFYLSLMVEKLNIVCPKPESAYFFVLRPVILPQPVWGRIAEKVQVLVA